MNVFIEGEISNDNYLNAVNRKHLVLHRISIMLTKGFESQKDTYLRGLVFAKKVVCTYGMRFCDE